MELKGNGLTVNINASELSGEWLVSAAQEIADAAHERGLELPFATGVIAVENTVQAPEIETRTPDTKESLTEQLATASIVYKAVIDTLNGDCSGREDVFTVASNETVTAEFDAWLTKDKLAYVAATQEADPNVRFTLVATPNVIVSKKKLVKAATVFGKNQPYKTYVYDPVYSEYSPKQLSGTDPSNGKNVVFSLIPSSFTPGMDGTVGEQRVKLAKLQADNPGLKVPSVFEAVTYWQTLRAQGENLVSEGTFYRTYIRHFDLPEQHVGGWLDVPDSYIDGVGGPYLYGSGVQYGSSARVSMG